MRVLHFAHSFAPDFGGTTTRLINLLADPRDTHFLYVPRPQRPPGAEPIPAEETFGNIQVRRHTARRWPAVGPLLRASARGLLRCVRDADIDLVQGHNPPTCVQAGLLLARQFGRPFIYEAHRLTFDSFDANEPSRLPGFVRSWMRAGVRHQERRAFEAANAIIVQTPMHRERLREVFRIDPERIHVIPMGVDEELFDPQRWAAAAGRLRAERGWTDKIVVLYNGFLGRANGIEVLLQTAQTLPADVRREVRIVVLGRGPLTNLVIAAARERPTVVEFLGLVDYGSMPAYYGAADIVVVPQSGTRLSNSNNPTKLIEAMAMERIVLGSRVGGISDLLEDGHTGRMFAADDARDLTRTVVETVREIGRWRALGPPARAKAVRERSWRHCRESLQVVYRQLEGQGR